MEILGEEVVSQGQYIKRIKRWIKGWVKIPGGKFTIGLTGPETEIEISVIGHLKIFKVSYENK